MYMKDDVKTSNELFLFPALSPRKFSLGDDDLLQTARAKGTVYICVCVCMCVCVCVCVYVCMYDVVS